ncbi:MAG TPA: hypothetical protein VG123_09435 [Streptosporangiaceae bacterium]|nr:hypothetical protein [Streptosporangiaceae bacterium]
MTPVPALAARDSGILPARPLAAQAHALRAAAQFPGHTGMAGLPVTADAGGIHISVPERFGSPAARITAVTFLAAILGSRPVRRDTRIFSLISAGGQIAGHDAHVTTSIDPHEESS